MEMNLENKIYAKEVEKSSPNSPLLKDCARAFVSGGVICCIGQAVTEYLKYLGCTTDDANIYTSVILIIIASIMTGLGLYAKLGKFAGAGSIVPITGFSNSVTAPAIEFKTEGFILGVGAKIFTVAGPVILYGVLTSMLVGIVYYIF